MAESLHHKLESLGLWWCNLMHHSARWPMRGRYRCATCGRRYTVCWESGRTRQPA